MTGAVELKHLHLTEKIIHTFYDVYNELGFGFLESVYEEAMAVALGEAGVRVARQVSLPVYFRGRKVRDFRADIIVDELVLLELKSSRTLESAHEAQLLHYLKSTNVEIGLLVNFGHRPQFRRLIFDNRRKKIRVNPCKSVAGVFA